MMNFLPDQLNNFIANVASNLKIERGLNTLIFHRVLPKRDYLRPGDPSVEEFDWQMKIIRKHFCPLSLREALKMLNENNLPKNAVCITFDDGYADNLTLASPVLKKWQVPATVFISSGFLDGSMMWNDVVIEAVKSHKQEYIDLEKFGLGYFPLDSTESRKSSCYAILEKIKYLPFVERRMIVDYLASKTGKLPDNFMLTKKQLHKLVIEGFEVGGHTVNHPILSTLQDSDAAWEIKKCKEILEVELDRTIEYFAYPNGKRGEDFNDEHSKLVEAAGFKAAFTTNAGLATSITPKLLLPRFTPWDKTPGTFRLRLTLNK